MSALKKTTRKRKFSSPAAGTSKVGRRFDKIRNGQSDLWGDENDDDDLEPCPPKKLPTTNKTYIVLSDSDEENAKTKQTNHTKKSRKKSSDHASDHQTSDNEIQTTTNCSNCLICSIVSNLTTYNCCAKHLTILTRSKDAHKSFSVDNQTWLPQQVMIIPVDDELIQRYLDPKQIYRLKSQTDSNSHNRTSRTLSRKESNLTELSDMESHNQIKNSTKCSRTTIDQTQPMMLSSINGESPALNQSSAGAVDNTFNIGSSASTSTTVNSFESPTVLDTCQLQQSSDQPIVNEDPQQASAKSNETWTPISDDTYAAASRILDSEKKTDEEITEFTPATARRTSTEFMASRLPKIQLKKGRYRCGKPIVETNNSSAPSKETRSSSSLVSASSSSTIVISNRTTNVATSTLATIIEDESLVLTPNKRTQNKSMHTQNENSENMNEGLSDTAMSCLLAQEEASQPDYIPSSLKTTCQQDVCSTLTLPKIVIEDFSQVDVHQVSADISQSSQLTNDQIDINPVRPIIPPVEKTTPVRVSYRMNPDGSRVSISRPGVTSTHASPMAALRRGSTDTVSSTKY